MTETMNLTEAIRAAKHGDTIHTIVLGSAGAYGLRAEVVLGVTEEHIRTHLGQYSKHTGEDVTNDPYPAPTRVLCSDRSARIYRDMMGRINID